MDEENGRRVPLGQTVMTPGALCALLSVGKDPAEYVERHRRGDWGEVSDEDKRANDHALEHGERLLSAYRLEDGTRLWIITEANRAFTTLLLPDEY